MAILLNLVSGSEDYMLTSCAGLYAHLTEDIHCTTKTDLRYISACALLLDRLLSPHLLLLLLLPYQFFYDAYD